MKVSHHIFSLTTRHSIQFQERLPQQEAGEQFCDALAHRDACIHPSMHPYIHAYIHTYIHARAYVHYIGHTSGLFVSATCPWESEESDSSSHMCSIKLCPCLWARRSQFLYVIYIYMCARTLDACACSHYHLAVGMQPRRGY